MILLSEYRLNKETISDYHKKGFRVAYLYENPKINRGEAVGILLDTLYKSTIELIEYLLFTKHKLVLKYKDTQYKLQSLDEWKLSYKENGRTFYKKHNILIEYELKRNDYLEGLAAAKAKDLQESILKKYNYTEKPKDLDAFVDTFSRLYNINVDLDSDLDKIICYNQLKNYINYDIPYMNEDISTSHTLEGQTFMYSNCIDIEEQDMFPITAFKDIDYQEAIVVTSYGDAVYLEDTIYKETKDYE